MAKQWEGWGASRQHGSPPAYAPAYLGQNFMKCVENLVLSYRSPTCTVFHTKRVEFMFL